MLLIKYKFSIIWSYGHLSTYHNGGGGRQNCPHANEMINISGLYGDSGFYKIASVAF